MKKGKRRVKADVFETDVFEAVVDTDLFDIKEFSSFSYDC